MAETIPATDSRPKIAPKDATPAKGGESAVSAALSELQEVKSGLIVEEALTQALPVSDIVFGGTVLLTVIMFHAFFIRVITGSFIKRSTMIEARPSAWRADLLFAAMVLALLTLHLSEVVLWSAALILGGMVTDWSRAAYFAANCYTALGVPFSLPHAWRMLPPIVAMTGIFSFAWTASVLVNFVSRYNGLRETILEHDMKLRAAKKRAR